MQGNNVSFILIKGCAKPFKELAEKSHQELTSTQEKNLGGIQTLDGKEGISQSSESVNSQFEKSTEIHRRIRRRFFGADWEKFFNRKGSRLCLDHKL
ncbi:MAG: hypothetical protein IJY82_02515 [Oscillospiraceae bacterium]|nr:hypothetical protein [Oscillospiraceae bacterium]